jgi:hypothetical protein
MKIETFKQLAWSYRFNPEIEVLEDSAKYDDYEYTNVQNVLIALQGNVLCKSCVIHKIDKGNGSFRFVYAPNTKYKKVLREKLSYLEDTLTALDKRNMFHAFRRNFNPVTNAKAHIGYKYSAKFDLKSFFDTVRQDMFSAPLNDDLYFIKGITRQGLPTSPMLASIALLPTAYNIEDEIKGKFTDIRMTVYADDITISFNERMQFEDIKQIVYKHVKKDGFKINYKKTKLKFGHKNGMRRIICGVAVGMDRIYRTRETKIKIREALHKEEQLRAIGLIEWSRNKPPRRSYNSIAQR